VWIWGEGGMGGLGLGPAAPGGSPDRLAPTMIAGVTNATDVALGSGSSIVGRDGSLRTWGDQRLGATARAGIERTVVPTRVPGVDALVRVWASSYSNLGLLRDGRVLAWGSVFVQP
jgi:alpha-tubulin suppressor-like RCC1 family protein